MRIIKMEEEKSSKSKKTKLLIVLISILTGLGILLITFSLLFSFGILGDRKAVLSSGEGEEESVVEITGSERADTEDITSAESEDESSDTAEENAEVILIPVEEVYEIITNGEDYFILDVRNQDEYDEAHIEGAVLIPVDTLESKLDELPWDKPIITYCKSGGRSAAAASILVENGFTEVYDMGGITEWIDKGYPTVSEE
jgi:rhodanese-related sulfurtransferase